MRFLALAAAVFLYLSSPAVAQDRHALVIGIDAYQHVRDLQKARNDARAVSEALTGAGFDTMLVEDADELGLLSALETFAGRIQPGDHAVFYFAGHGVEIEGQNYLLPADIISPADGGTLIVQRRSLPVADVIATMQGRGARVSLLILDACRNNPFPDRGVRSAGARSGLARTDPPEGVYVMYSAGAGQTALDRMSNDDPNPNSVFTRTLLPHLSSPGTRLREMVFEVRSEVRDLARGVGHDQFPAVYDQLLGEFYFTAPQEEDEPVTVTGMDPCVAAASVWPEIRGSQSVSVLQGFIADFGACETFAAIARERIATLTAQQPDDPVSPPDPPENHADDPEEGNPPEIAGPFPDPAPTLTRSFQSCTAIMEPEGAPARDLTNLQLIDAITACRAAMQEDPGNIHAVALLSRALRLNGQDNEAARLARIAAEGGDQLGMASLAFHYATGRGLGRSDAEAFRWNRAGAEAGSHSAMYNLAYMYEQGTGTGRDPAQAAHWYVESARAGGQYLADNAARRPAAVMREIQQILSREGLYSGTIDGAYGQQTRAAIDRLAAAGGMAQPMQPVSNGAAYDQCYAAAHTDSISFGDLQRADLPSIIALCQSAVSADPSNGTAAFLLGRALGAAGRFPEAVAQYRRGADLGDHNAMSNLGLSYQNGDGVARDYREAERWYRAALALGNAQAMNNLGTLYANGMIGPRDHDEALRWYRASAEAGLPVAMYNTARAYQRGQGTAQNDAEAARWYLAALRAGRDSIVTRAGEYPQGVMREIQRILSNAGYYDGALDGAFGSRTRAAMEQYGRG